MQVLFCKQISIVKYLEIFFAESKMCRNISGTEGIGFLLVEQGASKNAGM